MRKVKFEKFELYIGADRGYGGCNRLRMDDIAIDIGWASSEYQRSVRPDGDPDEIIEFVSTNTEFVERFIQKYGSKSASSIYPLFSFEEFKRWILESKIEDALGV